MVAGRRTESSTFFFPRCRMPPRGWTAPGPRLDRADENAVPAAVRPALGLCRNGELPPTRGVGRSSGIVRRLRFPLVSSFSFCLCDSCRGLKACRSGMLREVSWKEHLSAQGRIPWRPSFQIPSNVGSFLCKKQEVQAVNGRCEHAAKRCFSVSRPPSLGNSQKSLFPEIFSQLSQPTILINQRLLQRFSFASQLWLRAVGSWSAPTALECRTPANHGNATECRWRCRPLTTGGGLAACAVDAGGSS